MFPKRNEGRNSLPPSLWKPRFRQKRKRFSLDGFELIPAEGLKDTVFPKSIESIQKLSEVHTLIYVTSRERKTITATTEWLWRHGFPYGKVFCCTENNSKIISNKEYVFARYKDEILKQNAVMYDDDFSGKLHQIVSKYNIKLLQPDYVFGKKGFWLKEHKRLQKRNWKP